MDQPVQTSDLVTQALATSEWEKAKGYLRSFVALYGGSYTHDSDRYEKFANLLASTENFISQIGDSYL